MPITSSSAAYEVLDALSEAQFEYCLLHGADELDTGSLSDLDVAARVGAASQLDALLSALSARDLYVFLVHEHDVGSAALFIVAPDLRAGVQLDLMIDPAGLGKYGLRTEVGLDAAVVGNRDVASLAPMDSWLYEVRKRSAKHQVRRLAELLEHPPTATAAPHERVDELFSPTHAAHLHAVLAGTDPPDAHVSRRHAAGRLVRRVLRPSGIVVSISAPPSRQQIAKTVHDRLGQLVPRTAYTTTAWWNVPARVGLAGPGGSVRWRAGVVVDAGASILGATVRVDANDGADAASTAIVRSVAGRAEQHVRRWLARTSS